MRMHPFRLGSFWTSLGVALLLLAVVSGCGSSGETREQRDRGMTVLEEVDEPPEIVGGYARVDSLKTYPERAAEDGATGVVRVRCVVTARGRATRVRLVNRIHNALSTEALRVVRELRFRPGTVERATVPVEVEIPIRFP
jgi:TonB family protein